MRRAKITPPLSNAVTHILLALARSDLHGYGIMQEIVTLSGGEYKVGPGTLYDNIKTLLMEGFVAEFAEPLASGEIRRVYHLTKTGAALLDRELTRLRSVVEAGRQRLSPGPREARTGETR